MKLGAVQRRARKLVRPGPRADERHEGTRRSFPDLEFAVGPPGCDNQDLPAPRPDRGDDSSARRELAPPWIRDLRGAGGRQDAVVRSLLGIAETAISDDDGHACVAGPGEVRPPPFRQPGDPFDRYDTLRPDDVRDEGRMVPGPRPDLEHVIPRR